jgi:hypothetical protein
MLDDNQILTFCHAVTAHINRLKDSDELDSYLAEIGGLEVEPDQVADVSDSIDDFFKNTPSRRLKDGSPDKHWHLTKYATFFGGALYYWEDVQAAKGLRRGDLYVMDFGDRRAAYFTGQSMK